MKLIQPGVVALRPIRITINCLTQEMVDWWVTVGAEAQVITDSYWTNLKGNVNERTYRVRMPGGDWSHTFNDGSGWCLIHLPEVDAPTASLFCLKFIDNIINHDIKVPEYEKETA